jgi:hypothetical protein
MIYQLCKAKAGCEAKFLAVIGNQHKTFTSKTDAEQWIKDNG